MEDIMTKEKFIDKALEHLRASDPNHPAHRNEHKLLIQSLHDGLASCSCGGWLYSTTGAVIYEEIFEEYEKHVKQFELVTINGDEYGILRHSNS
jgi:hypothetical protein